MNPLTQVKRTQQINLKEASLGISDEASWHAKYRDSAYVFVGGVPFELTEGDLLAVFSQYGEVVDVNLVRDKGTGKSKGFAFLAYEDQRSTILAVDNLNGAKLLGRIVRVDHVTKYRKKEEEEEDEEVVRQRREQRGVCYAFQKGECNRGDSCRFSHDEQRNANTGWGSHDAEARWRPAEIQKNHKRDAADLPGDLPPAHRKMSEAKHKSYGNDEQISRHGGGDISYKNRINRTEGSSRDPDQQRSDRSPPSREKVRTHRADGDPQTIGKHSRERTENISGLENREKHSSYYRDSSSYSHRDAKEHRR